MRYEVMMFAFSYDNKLQFFIRDHQKNIDSKTVPTLDMLLELTVSNTLSFLEFKHFVQIDSLNIIFDDIESLKEIYPEYLI